MAGVEGCGVLVGFASKLPILLEGVDLGEIDPRREIVGKDADGLAQMEDRFIVASLVGEVPGGVDLADFVTGI